MSVVLMDRTSRQEEVVSPELQELRNDFGYVDSRIATAQSFLDDGYIKLTKNCVALIAGQTGKGKTTFFYSVTIHEIKRGGIVGFFTNEMSRADIRHSLRDALLGYGYSQAEMERALLKQVKIYSKDEYPQLVYYDKVYPFILKEAVDNELTLCIFDQLTGATKHSVTGKEEPQYIAMNKCAELFKDWQSHKTFLPPILMAQQANPKAKDETSIDMQAVLRNGKGTLEHVCLGILIQRDEVGTKLLIGKGRDKFVIGANLHRSTTVIFDMEKGILKLDTGPEIIERSPWSL